MPGARNLPFTSLLDPGDGTVLGAESLRACLNDAGVDPTTPMITTCGSGVTACILTLALRLLEIPQGKVYDGSWSQWGASPDRPVATGGADPR